MLISPGFGKRPWLRSVTTSITWLEKRPCSSSSIEPIAARLADLKERVVGPSTQFVAESQEVTILADKSVPFTVIKRIMTSCTSEGYGDVSLAVVQKNGEGMAI
jgi:hypothetical protein